MGHFLGVNELGVYRVGVTFIMLIFGILFNPVLPVAYSAFSRLQSDFDELKKIFVKMINIMAAVCIPVGMLLLGFANPVSSLLLGEKWKGIEIVIAIIGIMHSIAWLVGINPEVYRAIGKPDINTKLLFYAVIYYIPVYVLAAPHGLFVFCIARLLVAIIAMGLHIYFANKVLSLSVTYLKECIKVPLLASLVAFILSYAGNILINAYGILQLIKLSFLIVFYVLTYSFIMWLLDRNSMRQIINYTKRILV